MTPLAGGKRLLASTWQFEALLSWGSRRSQAGWIGLGAGKCPDVTGSRRQLGGLEVSLRLVLLWERLR